MLTHGFSPLCASEKRLCFFFLLLSMAQLPVLMHLCFIIRVSADELNRNSVSQEGWVLQYIVPLYNATDISECVTAHECVWARHSMCYMGAFYSLIVPSMDMMHVRCVTLNRLINQLTFQWDQRQGILQASSHLTAILPSLVVVITPTLCTSILVTYSPCAPLFSLPIHPLTLRLR